MNPNIIAVQRIQDYIEEHISEKLSLSKLSCLVGYSDSYTSRLFKQHVLVSLSEYIRCRKLSVAAKRLFDSEDSILTIAFDLNFNTHEGFTRAFYKQFGLNPLRYRMTTPPIPLFYKRSIRDYYNHILEGVDEKMKQLHEKTVFVQVKERPARKLILLRGKNAEEYWKYCEEVGCDVWGILSSIKDSLDEPLGIWLNDDLIKINTSKYVQGVEVSLDYNGIIPDGMEAIELPAQEFMEFHGEPYNPEDIGVSIGVVTRTIENYDPTKFGYEWALDSSLRYQYSPEPARGYIEALPVRKIR